MTETIYTIGYTMPEGVSYIDETLNLEVSEKQLDKPFILYNHPDQLKYYQLPDSVRPDEISISQVTKGIPINSKDNFDIFIKIFRDYLSKLEAIYQVHENNVNADALEKFKDVPNLYYFLDKSDANSELDKLKNDQDHYHESLFSVVKDIVPKMDLTIINLTELLNKGSKEYHDGKDLEKVISELFD